MASLGDFQPAAGKRVQQRQLAVFAGALAYPDRVLGDQPVTVELGQPADHGVGRALGEHRAGDHRADRQSLAAPSEQTAAVHPVP